MTTARANDRRNIPRPSGIDAATSEHPSSTGNSDAPRVTRRYRDMRGGGNIIGAAPKVPGTKMLRCNDFGVREPSSAERRQTMTKLNQIIAVEKGVKSKAFAREEANNTEVADQRVGAAVFGYLFG